MKRKGEIRPQGELRQSQVILTFGPGAMLDLPNHSVLIAGLEGWSSTGEEITETRLASKVARILNVPSIRLVMPPVEIEGVSSAGTGIQCYQFPEWFITQEVEWSTNNARNRSRLLVHRSSLTRGKFVDRNRVKQTVVPIRFVRACRYGHIGDIDWYSFVHGGGNDCAQKYRQLWIDERGTSGDLTEVWVRCECGKAERSVAEASQTTNRSLGKCDGRRPWLGSNSWENCEELSRLLIRTASNSYFSQKLTVITLPDRDSVVREAVNAVWDFLELVEDLEDVKREKRRAKVKEALEGIKDEETLAEILRRKQGTSSEEKKVKVAELETLISTTDEIGEDQPNGNFFAKTLPKTAWDGPDMKSIERIVLVHRLREVIALVGFTRFDASSPDKQGELEIDVRRAALAREVTWVPAVENKGEGIFLQFSTRAIEKWLERPDVQERGKRLEAGLIRWNQEHPKNNQDFPGLPYIMLHSFSHMLVTAVSLECGYPASSIRERIYAVPGIGYGVLLYTGTSDAEGTLGGLVQVGRRIHKLIHNAWQLGELCSNDPVCAQHQPDSPHEHRFLHGAACHGCLLIGETSCETQNDFLDRALVVRTVDNLGVEFFGVESS